jgi:hypothetical protein
MKNVFQDNKSQVTDPVDHPPSDDVLFVQGGLLAAKNSRPSVKKKIMQDVSGALGCAQGELDFIFSNENDAEGVSVFDLPDAKRRRRVIKSNHLDAAE